MMNGRVKRQKPPITPEKIEIRELKKKLQRIEMENDILKKALDIISRSDRTNIMVSYHQTNRKTDTKKILKKWPVFVDRYKMINEYNS